MSSAFGGSESLLPRRRTAVRLRRKVLPVKEGQSFRIILSTGHRMIALTDIGLLEASTPHLDDVVRLEGRHPEIPAASRH